MVVTAKLALDNYSTERERQRQKLTNDVMAITQGNQITRAASTLPIGCSYEKDKAPSGPLPDAGARSRQREPQHRAQQTSH